jgi:hypothetical protein
MKALISPLENNRIVEVKQFEFPIAKPLYWIDCPDNVTTEYTFNEKGFTAPQVVPDTPVEINKVSMRQARLVLNQYGYLTAVNTAIAQGNETDKIEWEYATSVNKNSDLVKNMVSFLSLTPEQVTVLFNTAASL